MLFIFNAFAFVAFHILFATVKGQLQNLIVNVGLQGSFFSPQTVSVPLNNTVTFEFFGDVHTVTQSSFDDPCNPIAGGFHSGYLGLGPNNSEPLQVWTLEITNVTEPIWYFCAVAKPVSHCEVGMVGAINPPSIDAFNSFSIAAKLITTVASIGPTPILTGQGAFASSTPTISALAVTPSPSLTSTSSSILSTSSSTPSPTTVPTTTQNLGAIVGGAVGGAVAVILLIFALWFFCMRNKQDIPDKQSAVSQNDDFFRYNPVAPVTTRHPPLEGFPETIASQTSGGTFPHNPSIMTNTISSSNQTARLLPLRRSPEPVNQRRPGPVILSPTYIEHQTSQQSDINSTSSNPTNTSGRGRNTSEQPPSNVDIRALAQQVAAVLYESPPKDYSSQDQRGRMAVQNRADEEPDYARSSQMTHQPPPNYRTAIGPSGPSSSVGSPSPGKTQFP